MNSAWFGWLPHEIHHSRSRRVPPNERFSASPATYPIRQFRFPLSNQQPFSGHPVCVRLCLSLHRSVSVVFFLFVLFLFVYLSLSLSFLCLCFPVCLDGCLYSSVWLGLSPVCRYLCFSVGFACLCLRACLVCLILRPCACPSAKALAHPPIRLLVCPHTCSLVFSRFGWLWDEYSTVWEGFRTVCFFSPVRMAFNPPLLVTTHVQLDDSTLSLTMKYEMETAGCSPEASIRGLALPCTRISLGCQMWLAMEA